MDNCCNKLCGCICSLSRRVDSIGLKTFQANLVNKRNELLKDGSIIPFDTIINDLSYGYITLDSGIVTVLKAGIYNINYYVNTNGTSIGANVKFKCNDVLLEANYETQGQVIGFATLYLNVNDTISVTNADGGDIRLGDSSIQAGILITTV